MLSNKIKSVFLVGPYYIQSAPGDFVEVLGWAWVICYMGGVTRKGP